MTKPYFCKLKKQQCIRRSATCWAQRVDTEVDWPNSFWDMTKPYWAKLKKQQCIRRSATCWAQRVDTKVDWPNSFWDMTKCFKPYFSKLKKQQCIRRSATWVHNALTQVDWPNSFWDMKNKVLNLIFANWRNNSVFGAALPAEHNVVDSRSIGPIVSEIWQNLIFVKLKKQQCIRRSATCWAQRVDTQQVDWPNSFWDMKNKVLNLIFLKLKKQQCIRRSATCWAQRCWH